MSRHISLIIVPEEGGKTINFRIPLIIARISLIIMVVFIVLMIIAVIFYGKLVREAQEVQRLRSENNTLLEQHRDYIKLKAELDKNRKLVGRIASLAGIKGYEEPDSTADSLNGKISADLSNFIPKGYPLRGYISKRFSESGLFGEKHLGLDISCAEGTPVRATADGVVESAGWDKQYGNIIKINHLYGYETVYAHNKELKVKKGDKVKKNQIIALSGNSGRSSGPHLHYEILKDGKHLDPEKFLQ